MTGTVRERGPGRWQVQISVKVDGRRKQVARTIVGTRADAVAALPVLAAEHGVTLDVGQEAGPDPFAAAEGERRPFELSALLEAAGASVHDLAERCGVHARTLYRWAESGLTEGQADVLAVRAGWHPAEVWEAWFAEAA